VLSGVGAAHRSGRLGAALLGLGLAFGAGHWTAHEASTGHSQPPVCRPSAPQRAADHAGTPILLFLGNSLIFDHGWRIKGATAVNCARQGLVARDAPALIEALPEMMPAMVVLGFGSVEALRAAGQGDTPVDPAGFGLAVRDVTGAVRARWPGATIVWLTVPEPGPGPIRSDDVGALNAVLAAVAAADPAVTLLDVNHPPLAGPAGPVSYDGVHLAEAVYAGWERALSTLFVGR
jgi:hypothetical protein